MSYKFGSSYLDRHVLKPLCVKIAAVERNWPYRIKRRILDMEPIENTGTAISLVTICRSSDFFDALWSLWSWLYYLREICAPVLVVDGKVDQTNKDQASRVLPGVQVISAEEFSSVLCNLSDDAREFCWRHVFGRKAATIIALQNKGPLLFMDPDVLVFEKPVELADTLGNLQFPIFSRNHVTYTVDPWMQQRIRACGLEMDPDFNSGIMALPKQTIDLETLKALLEGWRDSPQDHFAEQTLFSGLLISAGGQSLPASRYVARADAMWFWQKEMDYEGVVARHYVGPVRHHLYQKGMPYLCKLRGSEKSGRERST